MVIGGYLLFGRRIPAHNLAQLLHRADIVLFDDALQDLDNIAYLYGFGDSIAKMDIRFRAVALTPWVASWLEVL